jgi:hypothetical protein
MFPKNHELLLKLLSIPGNAHKLLKILKKNSKNMQISDILKIFDIPKTTDIS